MGGPAKHQASTSEHPTPHAALYGAAAARSALSQVLQPFARKDFSAALRAADQLYPLRDSLPDAEREVLLDVRAEALTKLGKFGEASSARQDQLAYLLSTSGSPNAIATVQSKLAWALYKSGNYQQSLQEAGRSYLTSCDSLGVAHQDALSALHLCIYNLIKLERFAEALPLAEELVTQRQLALPSDSPELEDARTWLALVRARTVTGTSSSHPPTDSLPSSAPAPLSGDMSSTTHTSRPRGPEYAQSIAFGAARGLTRGAIEALLS